MLNKKQYPPSITVKPILSLIGIFVVVLIVFIIIFNLAHTTRKSKNANNNSQQLMTNQYANSADTDWYKDAQIPVLVKPKPVVIQAYESSTAAQIQPVNSQQTTEENNQDLEKAMQASIASNQITSNQDIDSSSKSNSDQDGAGGETILPNGQLGKASNPADQNMQAEKLAFLERKQLADNDYLQSTLQNPRSPYELQASTVIPGVLLSGIDSDLPGPITGQVKSNIYDSISGANLLIPMGSKIVGTYDSQVSYGQERVLIAWKRIIFPNGQSINLQGMPGTDLSGYAGFHDQVNNHLIKIFTSTILTSALAAGAQLSQPQNGNNAFAAPSVGQTIAQSLGTNIANTGTALLQKNLNIQPTLKIRQGYEFNISVTKDVVFPGSYKGN